MNYAEALEFTDSFINFEKTAAYDYPEAFKLDRMRALAKELGNPQNAYDTIIVAGSKGKGSTAAFASSILRMENLKVGLYTSPHLQTVRERIQVNGLPINEARFTEATRLLRQILDTYSWRKDPPTYFEILTAMAFHHFKEMKVQVAVLEVGLGGLYDSTNIARAKTVGITPISLEHTDKLGKTIAKIAVQKAGVVKGREIVISAQQPDEADAVIQKACEENEAKLIRVRDDIKIFERDYGEDFQRFDLKTPFGHFYDLKIQMSGRYQIDNAALAVGLTKGLELRTRLKISEPAVRMGLLDTHWPGRLEKVWPDPLIILDGAHNAESMRLSLQGLKRHFQYKKLVAVLGVSSDKDIAGMLEHLAPEAQTLILTRSLNPRALPVKELKNYVENFPGEVIETDGPDEALQAARKAASSGDAVLVTGSLFVVGEMKTALGREN